MRARPVVPGLVGLALLGAALVPGTAAASGTTPTSEPTATSSPAPAPTIALGSALITAGQQTVVSGQATPGATVELHGYSQPQALYALLSTTVADETGGFAFPVAPMRNSRYFVREAGAEPEQTSSTALLEVRWAVTFDVERISGDSFVFTGSVLPATTGDRVVVQFERDGVNTAVTATRTSRGRYRAVLSGSDSAGAFTAAAVVPATLDNVVGRSAERRVVVVPSQADPEHAPQQP